MSKLIGLINTIHDECDVSWLLPSQLTVYEHLVNGFQHQRILNVYGDTGVGKTVLAWVLAREGYGIYCPDPAGLPYGSRRVLVDHFSHSRRSSRRFIDHLQEHQIGQAVVFTQKRIDDDIPCFEMALTNDGVKHCRSSLFRNLGLYFPLDREPLNLHDLLQSGKRG